MDVDVVIVGGGPNGLLLSCELALAGVRPLVLERLAARSTAQKANGLVGRVVQALELRGLYEPLAGRPGPAQPLPFYQFGGLPLDLRDISDNPLFALQVSQAHIERVLEERARELGVLILPGLRLRPYAHNRLPGGVFTFASTRPGAHLVATFEWGRPVADDTPAVFAELRAAVRRVLGTDLPMTPADAPVRRLTGETWSRISARMRAARPVLVTLTSEGTPAETAAPWKGRVDVVVARAEVGSSPSDPPAAFLVRPDGHLAWASDRPSTACPREALATWFGAPS